MEFAISQACRLSKERPVRICSFFFLFERQSLKLIGSKMKVTGGGFKPNLQRPIGYIIIKKRAKRPMMVGSYISPKHHEADDFCSKWETYLLSRTPCCPYEREQRMPANLLLCSLLARCGKDCMKEIRETCMIASNIPSSKLPV